MTTIQKYQWATGILAVLVIILGIWLISIQNQPVSSDIDKAKSALADCNASVSAWRQTNPNGATSTAAQTDLANILSQCADSL